MAKLNFLIALLVLGLVSRVAAATPPACILACVNEEDRASDFKAICAAESAQDCLAKACDNGEFKTAVSFFKKTCEDGGYSVAQSRPSATASGSGPVTGASATAGAESASDSANPDSAGNRMAGGSTMGVLLAAMAAFVLV